MYLPTPDSASNITANGTLSGIASPSGGNGPSIYDIFGVIVGVVGLVGLYPFIHAGIEYFLPNKRLKSLDDTMRETMELFSTVVNDGLFPNQGKVKSMDHRLSKIRREAERLRAKVHIALTFKAQLCAWWHGVSRQINDLRREVKAARAEISVICSRERERQERENRLPYQLLPTSMHAASRAVHSALAFEDHTGIMSAVNPRVGRATGIMGLHSPHTSLSTRAPIHAYPSTRDFQPTSATSDGHNLAPPPAPVLSSSLDPHKRLEDLTDQLSKSLANHGQSGVDIVHTPDHVACCNATPGTSDIQRTLNVLNDLTLRLSVVAASELLGSQTEHDSAASPKPVNSAQLGLLLDGLRAAQASSQRPSQTADVPSTASIEEINDEAQGGSQLSEASTKPLVDV